MGEIRQMRSRRIEWAFWQWARLLYPWCWPAGRWLATAHQLRGVDWLEFAASDVITSCCRCKGAAAFEALFAACYRIITQKNIFYIYGKEVAPLAFHQDLCHQEARVRGPSGYVGCALMVVVTLCWLPLFSVWWVVTLYWPVWGWVRQTAGGACELRT